MEQLSGFRITNDYGVILTLSLEPEGRIVTVEPGDSVEVRITANVIPAMDLQVKNDADGMYFSLWSENGDYQVFSNDEELT